MTHPVLERHRKVWSRKPLLREVYRRYFQDILDRCSPHRPTVELGSGPGFFKEFEPFLIATDVEMTPWIDEIADACDLPYSDGSVGNLVMVDVFHHLARPGQFLEESERVLCPGGRVVMLEPWTSRMGYRFYRHVHHEGADRHVDPAQPFETSKDALDGNAALPEVYFGCRDGGRPRADRGGRLHVVSVERLPAIGWLLSGGFQPYQLLPRRLLPLADAADRVLGLWPGWFSLRAMITLERPE